jgi:hypothetical protein
MTRNSRPEAAATGESSHPTKTDYERARRASAHVWAAMALALEVSIAASILSGRPVLARRLDATALRRALRGGELPPASAWITITAEQLEAVAEGGAFV